MLKEWDFHRSKYDPRIYLLHRNNDFTIIAVVVDDLAFASNFNKYMNKFKGNLSTIFDVKLFGDLKSLIR